mmetsp:Transcript_45081/g.95931  ORF Transcript_45081/g.95931 Transcript_45081/m.95931 type:complete len:107 (-) Transcript_45081:105-425(-)
MKGVVPWNNERSTTIVANAVVLFPAMVASHSSNELSLGCFASAARSRRPAPSNPPQPTNHRPIPQQKSARLKDDAAGRDGHEVAGAQYVATTASSLQLSHTSTLWG